MVGRQTLIQPLSLSQGPRIAIQHVAADGIRSRQPFCHHLIDQVVRNQLALSHYLPGEHT